MSAMVAAEQLVDEGAVHLVRSITCDTQAQAAMDIADEALKRAQKMVRCAQEGKPMEPEPAVRWTEFSRLPRGPFKSLRLTNLSEQLIQTGFGIAIEHPRVIFIEQRILDPGISSSLATLRHNDLLGIPNLENRHPGNW